MKRLFLTFWLLPALSSLAVRTETVTHDSYADFNKGDPKSVAITEKGLLQLAPQWNQRFDTGQPIVWALARDAKGNLYAGGGNEGQVFKLTPTGAGTQFFKADEIEIHALTVDKKGNLFVGTSPDGKVYKVTSDGQTNTFFEPKQKYIWALAFDKDENLFVATGNKGILYKVAPDGKGEVYYDSDETNLGCLRFDKNGLLLAGSDPSGYVYRLTPPDKTKGETNASAYVVFDAKEKEIKSIAAASDGTIYAAAIAENGKEGSVYRINTDNYAEPIWASKDAAPFSLLLRDDGNLLVGTGDKGMLLSLTPRGELTTLFRSDAAQITALLAGDDGKVIAGTSNLGTLLEISPRMAAEGVYDSEVIDTKIFAEWGRVEVMAQTPKNTQVELFTRTGNAAKPEKTWTTWMPVGANGAIASPAARFLQYRVRMVSKDGTTSPRVERARVFFSQRNVAPVITAIEVLEAGTGLSRMTPPPPPQQTSLNTFLGSGGEKKDSPPPMAGQVRVEEKPGLRTVVWKAEDPNKDELVFAISYRQESESSWRLLKDQMDETFYSWDSTSWPDGMYLLRIEANDANANPPGKGLSVTEVTRAFLVDNTPPRIEVGKPVARQRKATLPFKAADATSRIKEARYSVDGKDWQLIVPDDGVFDSPTESFQITTSELAAGDHLILIHVADELGNPAAASAMVTAK